MTKASRAAGRRHTAAGVVADEGDPDSQTLLIHYPSVSAAPDSYVRPSVKIELGAKSALDPHVSASVEPFIAIEMATTGLRVHGITTIDSTRTFWDKVIILHGLRRWFERRGELRQEGQRVTRHYYDVHCLLRARTGPSILADQSLAADCARHARIFFGRPDLDLEHAAPGTFAIAPTSDMRGRLERDYVNMAGMIFGPIPSFHEVLATISDLERSLNEPGS